MWLNDKQQAHVLALVDGMAWGDLGPAVTTLERELRLMLEATRDWFPLWMSEGEDRFGDEFSLTPAQVTVLSGEWRLAYVARLLVSMALTYGVSTGIWDGKPPVRYAERNSLAELLQGLNSIVHSVPHSSAEPEATS